MTFSALYDAVQTQTGRIRTKWLRTQAIKFSNIMNVREMWSGVMDDHFIRGFYIEGPLGPPLILQENEALITLARTMCNAIDGAQWRRFIFTKELMHVFDEPDEKTDTKEKFDLQINKFGDPTVPTSPQSTAEVKAYWRALAVLCTESDRKKYKSEIDQGHTSPDVVAVALRMPVSVLSGLFRDDFEKILSHIK